MTVASAQARPAGATVDRDSLPILVGLVGKRRLSETTRVAFEDRLSQLLSYLDATLPDTPKLLVCGGAAGADLAAARLVLKARPDGEPERPGWAVALVLPFDDDNVAQDFEEPAFAEDLRTLRDLAGDARVVRKFMRPLHRRKFDDGDLEPERAERFPPTRLRRGAGGKNRVRSAHYEQLGLWLARYATLLVAVGPAEVATEAKPHLPGGTARIVAYRRTAMPDARAASVIARSSELLSSSPFKEQDGGYVLWLDPTEKPPPDEWGGIPGVRVLRPIQRVAEVADAATVLSRVVADIYAMPMHDPYDDAGEHRRRGAAALTLALAFQRMHARRRGVWAQLRWWRKPPPPPFGADTPAAFLDAIRRPSSALSRQQDSAAAWTRRAQRASALLFFVALAGLETYTELAEPADWLLIAYVALLLSIAGLAWLVGRRKIQVRAEDFRGLKEMLRVQIAWWSAGIDRMVDRVHLRSIDTDLRLVREAAAAVTMWAVLRCTKLDTLNAAASPDPNRVTNWIDGQANYFAGRARPQFGAKRLAELAFQLTFAAAMSGIALLWLMKTFAPGLPEVLLPYAPLALAALPPAGALLSGFVLHRITRRARGVGGAGPVSVLLAVLALALAALVEAQAAQAGLGVTLPRWAACPFAWAPPLACAGALAALAALAAWRVPEVKAFDVRPLGLCGRVTATAALVGTVLLAALALPPLIRPGAADAPELVANLVLVQAILLLGGTGMVRWYTDRRNHLAQAAQYDDMLRAFRRAQDWWRHQGGDRLDRDAQDRLVQLGELALDENEAWLKAHRDRPAEPIAGA